MNKQGNRRKPGSLAEQRLTALFDKLQADPSFVATLEAAIARRASELMAAQPHARRGWRVPGFRTRLALGLSLLLLAALTLGFRPAASAVRALFSLRFVSGVGFVNTRDTLLLAGPTSQSRGDQRLTVVEATASVTCTRTWFRIEGPTTGGGRTSMAEGGPQPWLETEDGQRLEPVSWSWSEDSREGVRGYIEFGGLPAGATGTVFSWPPLWMIPLRFEPYRDSRSPYATLYPDSCDATEAIQLCAVAVISEETGTTIFLSGSALDTSLSLLSLTAANPLTGEDRPVLQGDSGPGLSPIPVDMPPIPLELPPLGAQVVTESLRFAALAPDATATLHIPAVQAQVLVGMPIQLSLRPDPRPGEVFDTDVAVNVGTVSLHFVRAEVVEGPVGVQVVLISEPVRPLNGRLVTGLGLATPSAQGGGRRVFGSSFDVADRVLRVWWDLQGGEGDEVAIQTVMVETAEVTLLGPFRLRW